MAALFSAVINTYSGLNGVTVDNEPSSELLKYPLLLFSLPKFLVTLPAVTIQTTYIVFLGVNREGSARLSTFSASLKLPLLSLLTFTDPLAAGTTVEFKNFRLVEQDDRHSKINKAIDVKEYS